MQISKATYAKFKTIIESDPNPEHIAQKWNDFNVWKGKQPFTPFETECIYHMLYDDLERYGSEEYWFNISQSLDSLNELADLIVENHKTVYYKAYDSAEGWVELLLYGLELPYEEIAIITAIHLSEYPDCRFDPAHKINLDWKFEM